MLKDLFLIKKGQIPKILLVVLSALAIFFLAQYGVAILVAVGMSIAGKSQDEIIAVYGDESYWPKAFVMFLISAAMVFLTFRAMKLWDVLASRRKKHDKKTKTKPKNLLKKQLEFLKLNHRPTAAQIFETFGFYILYVITIVLVGTVVQATSIVNVEQTQDLGVSPPTDTSSILAVLFIFLVLPPISEEILFRGYLYNKVRRYAPIGLSALITSILFGVAHLEYGNLNWIAAIDTFVFSLYLIFISQKHQSLYSSILLHALKNSLAVIIFLGGL